MDFREYLEKGSDHFLPNLSIDLVIIGYRDRELKCLLLKIGDRWLLPGGHIRIDESVVEAVSRILKDRTALENPHMSFLSVFGNEDRHFSEEFQAAFENLGIWGVFHAFAFFLVWGIFSFIFYLKKSVLFFG